MSENMNKDALVKTLIAQLESAKLALKKARQSKEKKFRIETTQTANNFHISFNQLFDINYVKEKYKGLIISETEHEIVFKVELKDCLKDEIINALNK